MTIEKLTHEGMPVWANPYLLHQAQAHSLCTTCRTARKNCQQPKILREARLEHGMTIATYACQDYQPPFITIDKGE